MRSCKKHSAERWTHSSDSSGTVRIPSSAGSVALHTMFYGSVQGENRRHRRSTSPGNILPPGSPPARRCDGTRGFCGCRRLWWCSQRNRGKSSGWRGSKATDVLHWHGGRSTSVSDLAAIPRTGGSVDIAVDSQPESFQSGNSGATFGATRTECLFRGITFPPSCTVVRSRLVTSRKRLVELPGVPLLAGSRHCNR